MANIIPIRHKSIYAKTTRLFAHLLNILAALTLGIMNCGIASGSVRASVSKDYDSWQHLSADDLNRNADRYLDNAMPDSAMVCYAILANRISCADTPRKRHEATCGIMNLGYMHSCYYYDFSKAFEYFSNALALSEQDKDNDLTASCYVNLGSLYSTYHQMVDDSSMMEEAVNMYRRAYHLSKEADNKTTMLTSVYNLAVVYLEKGNLNSLLDDLNDFLAIHPECPSARHRHVSAFIRGLVALADGRHSTAEKHLNESLSHRNPAGIPERNVMVINLALCLNAYHSGKLTDAETLSLNLLRQARQHRFHDLESILCQLLGKIYGRMDRQDKTREYRLRYFDLKDSLINASKIKEVKTLRFLNELNTKNKEVTRLSRQKKSQGLFLTVVTTVLAVVAVVLLIIMIHAKRLRRRNLELYERLQESLDIHQDAAESDTGIAQDIPTQNTEPCGQEPEDKYRNSPLSHEEKTSILAKVKKYMTESPQIFTPDFSLETLARELAINRNYLSQVINETGGSNFKTLLNSYRIREACRRFEDGASRGQTIEAIGQGVGFMSRRNFGVAFKKETGLSPSAFVKIHREKHNER